MLLDHRSRALVAYLAAHQVVGGAALAAGFQDFDTVITETVESAVKGLARDTGIVAKTMRKHRAGIVTRVDRHRSWAEDRSATGVRVVDPPGATVRVDQVRGLDGRA